MVAGWPYSSAFTGNVGASSAHDPNVSDVVVTISRNGDIKHIRRFIYRAGERWNRVD